MTSSASGVLRTTIAELRLLLARVEQATGPDHELDRDLSIALLGESERQLDPPPEGGAQAYTSSLDATLELMQRVLPQWAMEASRYGHPGGARATIWPEGLRPERYHEASCATLPLAVLAAILKAMMKGDFVGEATQEDRQNGNLS